MRSQRVGHVWVTKHAHTQVFHHRCEYVFVYLIYVCVYIYVCVCVCVCVCISIYISHLKPVFCWYQLGLFSCLGYYKWCCYETLELELELEFSFFPRCIPRGGIAGSYGNPTFSFLRSLHIILYGDCTSFYSHQQYRRVPLSSHSLQHLLFVHFWMIAMLNAKQSCLLHQPPSTLSLQILGGTWCFCLLVVFAATSQVWVDLPGCLLRCTVCSLVWSTKYFSFLLLCAYAEIALPGSVEFGWCQVISSS